jgi:hypothetical protein
MTPSSQPLLLPPPFEFPHGQCVEEEEEDAESEVSGWELRERREREEERRQVAEGLGAEVEEVRPLFLPTLLHGLCGRRVGVWGMAFLCLSFVFLSLSPLLFPWCALSILGQAWAEGNGNLATSRLRADKRIVCISP